MQFVHQHRTDIHIRIDDSAGIIVETYAVYGCQHPAVSVTYSFRRPRLPPIGRCIRSGLVHTNLVALLYEARLEPACCVSQP